MRYFISILILLIFSCSSTGGKKENNAAGVTHKFGYINLSIILKYMIDNDPDTKDVKKREEDTLQKINIITEQINNAIDEANKNELLEMQRQYKNDLARLKGDEEHYKKIILNRIDNALENIAKKSDLDFIFNLGEGTLYAKREYDITEEVLKEIIKIKELSAPVSR